MKRGSGLWTRLVATGLLAAMLLPVTLELRLHRQDQGLGGIAHVEAANFQHHADQCLGNAAVTHNITSPVPPPVVACVGPEPVALPSFDAGLLDAEPVLRPSSRAPPVPFAV